MLVLVGSVVVVVMVVGLECGGIGGGGGRGDSGETEREGGLAPGEGAQLRSCATLAALGTAFFPPASRVGDIAGPIIMPARISGHLENILFWRSANFLIGRPSSSLFRMLARLALHNMAALTKTCYVKN